MASPGDTAAAVIVAPHTNTDKKNREIPEARQLRFEDDEMPLKRLKTSNVEAPK